MTPLYILLAGGLLALWWRASVESRALANAAAFRACEDAGVQLLDGTVAFRAQRVVRAAGGFRLRRTYVFDYSEDGASRRQGFVVLAGHDVELVGLGPTLVNGRAA
jgi:predicted homoserine dehydrogenase-like protein